MIKLWGKKQKPKLHWGKFPYGFDDLDGRVYRPFPPNEQFPLERFAKSADIIGWMSAGLTGAELAELIEAGELELENMVKGKPGSLSKIGAIFSQIKMRRTLSVHHELMYQFIAVHYLREDEPIYTISDEIMNEKILAFKKMVAGGRLLDFFHLPELNNICNTIGLSKEEFEQSWSESITEQRLMKQKIQYLTSVSKSQKNGKTSQVQ